MEEILLGFHLRVAVKNLEQWDSERRATYLLRRDIATPLSVDHVVWPMADNEDLLLSLFSEYHGPHSVPNGLNIYSLKNSTLLKKSSHHNDTFLIGITVINDPINTAQKLKTTHRIEDIPCSTEQLQKAGWTCVGYDVADEWLFSGLMNCGSEPPVMASLSNRFAHALNEFGLFDSVRSAKEFRIDCDTRVPGHAPFAVYGIWAKGKPLL